MIVCRAFCLSNFVSDPSYLGGNSLAGARQGDKSHECQSVCYAACQSHEKRLRYDRGTFPKYLEIDTFYFDFEHLFGVRLLEEGDCTDVCGRRCEMDDCEVPVLSGSHSFRLEGWLQHRSNLLVFQVKLPDEVRSKFLGPNPNPNLIPP
jgi:hypothetical protein